MRTITRSLTTHDRAVLDRAMRHLTDSMDIDSMVGRQEHKYAMQVWKKLTEAILIQCHEVDV